MKSLLLACIAATVAAAGAHASLSPMHPPPDPARLEIQFPPQVLRLLDANDDARSALQKRDFDAMIAACDRMLEIAPLDVRALYMRGLAWWLKGDRTKGLADLDAAIRDNPGFEGAYKLRGEIHADGDEFAQAIADFTEAIRLQPKDADAYVDRASALNNLQHYEKADGDATRALVLTPGNADALLERGEARMNEGKLEAAMKDLRAVLAADPHNVMAHASMGAAYEITGNYKKALAQFDQVVALQPKTDGSYGLRADVRAHLKDYAGALADYSQATLLDPADPGNWRDLAWLLATCPNAKVRDGKRAVEAARKACELSRWQDADDVDALAAALAESGDFAGAVKFEQWYLTLPGVKDGDALSAKSRLAGYQVGKPWRD